MSLILNQALDIIKQGAYGTRDFERLFVTEDIPASLLKGVNLVMELASVGRYDIKAPSLSHRLIDAIKITKQGAWGTEDFLELFGCQFGHNGAPRVVRTDERAISHRQAQLLFSDIANLVMEMANKGDFPAAKRAASLRR